jgi:hypothetical protein
MPLKATQKPALEQHISGIFDNSPLLQSVPLAQWMVYKVCNLPSKQSYPSLLESLSRLGLYLAATGLTVSLIHYTIVPALCCGAVMTIFRYTIIELRRQAAMNNELQTLKNVNTRLEKTLAQQLEQTALLQNIISTAALTTTRIAELQKQEQQSLDQCLQLETRLASTTATLNWHTQQLEAISQKLHQEVNRLCNRDPH